MSMLEKQLASRRPSEFEEDHLTKIISKPKRETSRPRRQMTRTFFIRLEQFEIEAMAAAEAEQRRTDRFWGLDKAAVDRQREALGMEEEERWSRKYHDVCQRQLRQQAMRKEQLARQREAEAMQAQLEERMREEYFKVLHGATSSAQITHYAWPSKLRFADSVAEQQQQQQQQPHGNSFKWPQRSCKISHLVVHQSPQAASADVQKDIDPSRLPSRGNAAGWATERATPRIGKSRGRSRQHVSSGVPLTGHPIFHWDQLGAIRSVLQEFEDPDGTLGDIDEVMQELRSNLGVKLTLRYTMLGALMKAHQWQTIEQLFGRTGDSDDDTQSSLTVDEVLHALRDLAYAADVPVRRIQLPNPLATPHSRKRGSAIADDEEGAIARYLTAEVDSEKSPLVFALFRRGAHYLPACVEGVSGEGNTFSLRYLLSPEDDAQLARFVHKYCGAPQTASTSTRSLGASSLHPSDRIRIEPYNASKDAHNRELSQHHEMLRHAKSEEDVLRIMFSIVDTEHVGLADPQALVDLLNMPTWRRTVATLDSLRALSKEQFAQKGLTTVQWSSEDGRIGLLEWLEFCLALKDYSSYEK